VQTVLQIRQSEYLNICAPEGMSAFRNFLILSRVAGLPTIWSNCLAGWWLGGHSEPDRLPFLFAGATLLYIGASFLNDAFDAESDQEDHPARPIPSGVVPWKKVWQWGLTWLALGVLVLLGVDTATAALGLGLVACIILYNTVHKALAFSPVLYGLCRFFLYLMGASASLRGVTGWSIWCGLALAAYVGGVGCFMRWDRKHASIQRWPALLLAVPILLALIMDADVFRQAGLLLSAVLALWVLLTFRQTWWTAERDLKLTVARLQSGIVLVDWLACADGPRELSLIFLGLFGATLLLQRFVPKA
jgi:hypothetical protein